MILAAFIALLSAQAAPADTSPAAPMLACVRDNYAEAERIELAAALESRSTPPPLLGTVMRRLIARCDGADSARRIPMLLGFALLTMPAQRDVISDRMGIPIEQRGAFAAALLPFADSLHVAPDGREFGPAEISDAMLGDVRAALAAAGVSAPVDDRRLRKYLELLARERVILSNMNQMMAGQ